MGIGSRMKKLGWTFVHEICWQLSKIVPKDDKTWIFGAWDGKLFSDNSKYMYTYILEKHRDIKAVWITKEKNLALAMRELGYKCYFYHEWRGIVSSVRAAVIFTTSGYGDVAEWAHPNTLHVSLWHGTPLKKIGYDNIAWEKYLAKSKIQKFKEKFIPYVNRDSIHTIYTVSSEEVKNKFITAFRAMPNQVFITGQPRNDCFIHPKNNEYFDQIKEKNPDVKIVCYLPTHRNFGTQNNSPINKYT